jgi:hypothetical protein
MELNELQREKVIKAFKNNPDLISITREVFENDELKGSSKEGRAIRGFLLEKGLNYKTTKHKKKEQVELTEEQKKFIDENYNDMNTLDLAKTLFTNKRVMKLGLEQRAVIKYVRKNHLASEAKEENLGVYSSPKASSKVIKKINDATGEALEEGKLTRQHFLCVEKLKINLSNSRFVDIINNYRKENDRKLFEDEFIRLTWDKYDLSADEINLYMNVAMEIINMKRVTTHMEKLDEMFEASEKQADLTVRLSELIKAKNDEYHKCEKRIEDLTTKLQGERKQRIQKQQAGAANFLMIVKLFQDEEERKNMIKIADMQKELVEKEADRLENMDMWVARVLGAERDDLL